LPLKILRNIFADPAPVAAFREWGEGGTPENPRISRNGLAEKALSSTTRRNFFYNGSPLQ